MTMPSSFSALGLRDLTFVALGAGFIVALGAAPAIPVGLLPVPITLQSMGVMLAGLMLGPRKGGFALAVVLGLVAMGLPVLAGGRGGLAVLVGPTAGYLIGWVGAALVIGLAARRAQSVIRPVTRGAAYFGACLVGGVLVVHLCGVAWLAFVAGLGPTKATIGTLIFVPGDVLKAALAALVCLRIETFITLDRT
jgi:biotin transport system substrate-specific component